MKWKKIQKLFLWQKLLDIVLFLPKENLGFGPKKNLRGRYYKRRKTGIMVVITLKLILAKQERIKDKRVNPPYSLIPRVILLEVFLDMVLGSSADITHAIVRKDSPLSLFFNFSSLLYEFYCGRVRQ